MKIALAANPQSGGGDGDPDRLVDLLRQAGAQVEQVSLASLEQGLPVGTARLVVAGGDGTIGVAAAAARAADVAFAVVPTGTANDFARAMRLPFDLDSACSLAADPASTTRTVDVATFDGHPYVNAAAAGLTVHASSHATPLKSRLGALAYPVGAAWAGVSAPTLRCRMWRDGEECFAGEVWQVVVAATGAFGGGSAIGGTRTDDGELDIALVPASSRIQLIRRAWGMRTKRLTQQPGVGHQRGRDIEIETPEGTRFNVDGELRPTRGVTKFGLLSGGVQVVTR